MFQLRHGARTVPTVPTNINKSDEFPNLFMPILETTG